MLLCCKTMICQIDLMYRENDNSCHIGISKANRIGHLCAFTHKRHPHNTRCGKFSYTYVDPTGDFWYILPVPLPTDCFSHEHGLFCISLIALHLVHTSLHTYFSYYFTKTYLCNVLLYIHVHVLFYVCRMLINVQGKTSMLQ